MSWRSTSSLTVNEEDHYSCEGTAVFSTGEEAHLACDGTRDKNSSSSSGTSTVNAVYRFNDGSSFTIHFVAVWNATMSRNGGVFVNGTGRFAGIIGSATAAAQRPASGPATTVWTAMYELIPPTTR
jgi:hypothetical protein